MICPNKKCKKEIQIDSKLCPYCGYNISIFLKNSNELFLYAKNMIENREYVSAKLALREASRLGNSYAMVLFGSMYEKGLGVSYNDNHICYCYENAAKLKNRDAIYFLAKAFMNGTYGKEKDYFKAFSYYQELDLGRRTSEFELLENWAEEKNVREEIESKALGDFVLERGNIYEFPFEEPIVCDNSEDVIFEERNNFKKCLGELDESIESLQSNLKKVDSIVDFYGEEWLDWKNAQEYNKTIESSIESLKKKRRTPYIGRMKLRYEDGNESDIYVGREVITNSKGEVLVHSWFSDIGNKIYNDVDTSYIVNHKTINLLLKRMIDIQNAVFINATEVFNIKYGNKFLTIRSDDYLKKILSQKKNYNQLTDIIATIQYNQNQIITFDSKKNMVMQGCAGSGKTMVLLG